MFLSYCKGADGCGCGDRKGAGDLSGILHPDRLRSIAAEDKVVDGTDEAVLQCFANDDIEMLMAA